jgi:nicotinamidase/pyrazinamidase
MGSTNSSQVRPCLTSKKFIIGIIDVQNDFCKGGALAVNESAEAIAAINKLRYLYDDRIRTFISQDWHNEMHMSFAETHKKQPFSGPEKLTLKMEDGTTTTVDQMMWPRHCVENTIGAQLHQDLIITKNDIIIKKGTKENVESYSAFGDEFGGKYEKTKLNAYLTKMYVTDIILTGFASDYCVYNTALDAIRLGFEVHIILSCIRGVAKETTEKAFSALSDLGVRFYDTVDIFNETGKTWIA